LLADCCVPSPELGQKLTFFAAHLAGAAFGVSSVAWALRFHSLLAAAGGKAA
jgi:hypothetical protein